MTFIDIFCGIGTIRMGFEKAHHECVYSIEWDKWKRKIYSIIFGGEPDGTDIRTIKSIQLPKADCWCFGFPCQDISVAGKQLGFNGDRSSLFFEVMRLLQETKEENKPEYLFIENVKNLFSVNKGWDFFNLLYSLDEGGYDAEWQLLNSKDFGVPQNRERVFIIGHLRGRCTRKIFPIEGSNSKALKRVIGGQQGQRVYSADGLSCTLSSHGGGQGAKTGLYLVNVAHGNMKLKKNNISNCIDANYYKGLDNHQGRTGVLEARAVLTPNRLNKRQNGRRFKEPGEPMFTLTKQDIHGVEYQNRIRRLTPKECWRLQGIPDEITNKVIAAGISDTQMYRGAGDATTVNVIYEIAKKMS